MKYAKKHSIKFFGLLCFILILFFQNCGENSSTLDQMSMDSEGNLTILNEKSVQEKSSNEMKSVAVLLVRRLAGKTLPLDDEFIIELGSLLENGKAKEAVNKITNLDGFYNITVREFAAKMSVLSGKVNEPLNDLVASFIGVARDNTSAQELLTGNFYYMAKSSVGNAVRRNEREDIIESNNHYEDLDSTEANLREVLERVEGQKVISNGGVISAEDTAGVITSRAFMSAHAVAGTNRRIIEYMFNQFLCAPIASWADGTISDAFVGRDIGRTPQKLYNNKCKTCHSPMDALRASTAYFNFKLEDSGKGFIDYRTIYNNEPDPLNPSQNVTVPAAEQEVPSKFRRGANAFHYGFTVKDNIWVNPLRGKLQFGWSEFSGGEGLSDLGKMFSESPLFGQCMVKRAFKVVCKRDLENNERPYFEELGRDFMENGFSLRGLFEDVALSPECLGVQL